MWGHAILTLMRHVVLACLLAFAAGEAGAVPAYLRLYQQRYHVTVASCAVCHTGGAGGKLTDYGRDVMKAGGNWNAFDALDRADADGDRAANGDEAKAGSNPGDPASTPRRPGNWLQDVKLADQVPLHDLAEMFPKAGRFEAADFDLSSADAEAIGKALGAPLAREDRLGTVYFAVDAKAVPPVRTGAALFTAGSLPDGVLVAAVAVDRSGTIVRAWGGLYAPTGRESLKELARQLAGRPHDAPLVLGKTVTPVKGRAKLSEQGLLAFRKALLILGRRLAAKG